MYYIELDEAARREWTRRTRLPNVTPRTRDRLEMVRLCASGWSIPEIADYCGAHQQTVRHWIKAFIRAGFDALNDRPHTGKHSAITDEILAAVKDRLGERDRSWTAQQVADWVTDKFGITRSAKQWRRLLGRIGQSYKRTGRTLHHKQNPDAVQAAKQEMAALEEETKKGAVNCPTSATSTRPGCA